MTELIVYTRPSRAALVRRALVDTPTLIHTVKDNFFDAGLEPNFYIPSFERVPLAQHIVYVADWSSGAQRYLDLCVLWPLAEMHTARLTIVIPFEPSATMERETIVGEVATANVNAKMLSALPGAKEIVFVDLHTLQNKFYFTNTAVSLRSMMPYVAHRVPRDAIVVFPDDGARKRFATYFDKFACVACTKERVGDERRIRVDGDVAGKRTVIVDDLTRTGGTLGECALALRTAGSTSVGAYVTHNLMTTDGYALFLGDGKYAKAVDFVMYASTALNDATPVDDKFRCVPFEMLLRNIILPDLPLHEFL